MEDNGALKTARKLEHRSDYPAAINVLNKALEYEPRNVEVHALIAHCYRFLSDAQCRQMNLSEHQRKHVGLFHINKAAELQPDNLDIRLRRADLLDYWEDTDPSQALAEFREVLRRDPQNWRALEGIAVRDESLTPEQKLLMHEKAVELASDEPTCHLNLASTLFRLRRSDRTSMERARRHLLESMRLEEIQGRGRLFEADHLLKAIEDALKKVE